MNKLRLGVELWRSLKKSTLLQTTVCYSKKVKIDDSSPRLNKPADKTKASKSMTVGAKIKRLNWENVNLYGPLLTTAKQKKKKQLDRDVDEVEVEAELSGLIAGGENNRAEEKHIKVLIVEAGDRDEHIEPVTPLKTQVRDTVFEFTPAKPSQTHKNVDEDVQSKQLIDLKAEKLDDLKLTDSTPNLKDFPLCVGDDNETLKTRFNAYCQNILGIDGESNLFPASVTSILQQSMSEESRAVLERWENEMIEKLGLDGFHKFKQELFLVGRLLHKRIETRLSGQLLVDEDPDERVKGYWKSVGHVFKDISQVQLLETKVNHPILRYKGILDCVARYKDSDVVVEWKTSQRPRVSLKDIYDNPLQVAAYAGALNYGQQITQQVNRGLVVIAYSSGAPAHVHFLDQRMMEHFWGLWLQRLEKYLLVSHQIST